jgi:hypothetical protein
MNSRRGGGRVTFAVRRIEVAAAFLEDVDEELLHAAAVLGIFAAELIDHNGEGARYFVFVEAGAAHGFADADARGMRGRRGARIECGDGQGGRCGRGRCRFRSVDVGRVAEGLSERVVNRALRRLLRLLAFALLAAPGCFAPAVA